LVTLTRRDNGDAQKAGTEAASAKVQAAKTARPGTKVPAIGLRRKERTRDSHTRSGTALHCHKQSLPQLVLLKLA
jgi:hypothetical protein